jgi:hypothetical protein
MSVHDAVLEHRKRVVRVIERSDNKRQACRDAGIHHSTFYRWRKAALADTGPAVGGQRRSWSDQMIESRIVAAALAYPALGPLRVADQLAVDGIIVSASKVWRTLVTHRINTRQLRYLLTVTPWTLAQRGIHGRVGLPLYALHPLISPSKPALAGPPDKGISSAPSPF